VIAGDLTKRVLDEVARQEKRAVEMLVEPDEAGLASLAALAEEDRLTVHVDATFPLERAAEAHERQQSGRVRGSSSSLRDDPPVRAVVMTAVGGPEVLELQEVERPEPVQTEVLVRVTGAGINPVDYKTRRSGGNPKAVGEPPFVLGWDVAGVVEETSRSLTRFTVGDRVFGMPGFPRLARA
jgi:NADPH:quinone reductase-like Zn-dependent oxidoreductase